MQCRNLNKISVFFAIVLFMWATCVSHRSQILINININLHLTIYKYLPLFDELESFCVVPL